METDLCISTSSSSRSPISDVSNIGKINNVGSIHFMQCKYFLPLTHFADNTSIFYIAVFVVSLLFSALLIE